MTEHSKIPLPPEGTDEAKSMIERAARSFRLDDFAPPPVPETLAPPPRRLAARTAAQTGTPHQATPPQAAPSGPAAPLPPAAAPAPVQAQPAAPLPRPVAAAPAAEPAPASFAGPCHPVDRGRLREQGLIVPEGAVTAVLEEFRIVKRQLLQQAADLSRQGAGAIAQRILIGSPLPGEGKTFCAINLALSIAAEKENEVLLVDADFAKPSVLGTLGLPAGPGLMDALTDPSRDVCDFVIGTDIPGLWVLPAGSATASDTEYLNASRTRAVLDRLTQGAPQRIVLFDSPPALAASPAAELARHVGQTVVVVRADSTGQGALDDAISLLSACPNIQLLLNGTNFSPSGRRFGSYHGYGG